MDTIFPSGRGNCAFAGIIRYFSILGMAVAFGIEGLILYSLYHILLPYYHIAQNYSAVAITIIWIEALIAPLVVFNYLMAACSSPGYSSEYRDVLEARFSNTGDEQGTKFCHSCNLPKPKNVHHCSICQKCIVHLDHHCPWIMNCVGYKNMKFFLLFITYSFFGCLLHTSVAIGPLLDDHFRAKSEFVTVLLAGALTTCFSISLLFFNLWSWGLVLTGNSVITMLKSQGRVSVSGFLAKFKKDIILRNLQIHFHTTNPLIAILPSCKKPTEDPFVDEYFDVELGRNMEVLSLEPNQGENSEIAADDSDDE